jgi:hypothetical protein
MTKPKLDIRQMIKDGKITTDKAGQLVALEVYENSGILKESDIRALRETAKDPQRYNAFMEGVNLVGRIDNTVAGLMTDARLTTTRIAWALSEIRYTVRTLYQEPPVRIVTPEAYDRLGKEKRERRLKRTYTLMTLYRIVAENIVKNPEGKAQEQAVEQLRKDTNPKDGEVGMLYGLDLIEQGYEIWTGWTAYHHGQDFTLADLANDLPDYHALVMDVIKGLYKAKQLSIDPESIKLNKWHTTPLKGSELAGITGIKMLDDNLNLPESRDNTLDEYDDPSDTKTKERDNDLSDRAYYELYTQKYAVISRPDLYERELKDGVLDVTDDIYYQDFDMWTKARMGYGALKELSEERGIENDTALEFIKQKRAELIEGLKVLFVLHLWRLKAGKLLGIENGDRFQAQSARVSPRVIFADYNNYRDMYLGAFNGENVTNPDYQRYLDLLQGAIAPLLDMEAYEALSREEKLSLFTDKIKEEFKGRDWLPGINGVMGYNQLKEPYDLTERWLVEDIIVAECFVRIGDMTLETISSVYEDITDKLLETDAKMIERTAGYVSR